MTSTTASPRSLRARLTDYMPIVEWLPRYDRTWLRPDILAAATVWALVVPQAIAYAQIAGLPPEAGLFATFAGLLGYALFGTSRQLIVSPTSSTAAISASIVAAVALDPSHNLDLSAALALLVGASFIVFGLARVGFISRFIAPSVQTGFMFGLGMTIIIGQVPALLGLPGGVDGNFLPKLFEVIRDIGRANFWTAVIGLGSLAALFAMRKFAPRLPAALIVVVVSIALVTFLNLAAQGVDVIGLVNGAIAVPAIPQVRLGEWVALLPGALAISVIGFAETITVGDGFAEKHKYEIRPNQELVAVGAANVFSGLFQGFIVGGGASQSAANDAAGARSQIVSLIVSALTILTSLFLLPLFQNLPQAALAAIVIVAVSGFFNVRALQRIARLRRESYFLALLALASVLLLGVLPGLLIAIVISLLLGLGHLARPNTSILGRAPDSDAYVSLENEPNALTIPGVLIFRLDAALTALNAKRLRDRLRTAIRSAASPVRLVVLDLSMTDQLDLEGLEILSGVHRELREQSIGLRIAGLHTRALNLLRADGVEQEIGATNFYRTVNGAMQDVAAP